MSTNISDIMYEMECAGIAKDRVRDIVVELILAGRQTLLAITGEIAGHASLSKTEFELTVANIVALAGRQGDDERRRA